MSPRSLRITVVDDERTISFVAPGHLLKMTAAACARDPRSIPEFVAGLGNFDPDYAASLAAELDAGPDQRTSVLVVEDEETRSLSLEPEDAGVVVVNLPARRIVQVRNEFGEIQRADRGRMRRNGRPLQIFYHYELSEEWVIVP